MAKKRKDKVNLNWRPYGKNKGVRNLAGQLKY